MQKIKTLTILVFLVGLLSSCHQKQRQLKIIINQSLDSAMIQYKQLALTLADKPDLLPRSYDKGEFITSKSDWWTSGFFPGSLWYLYEYSCDDELKKYAEEYTARVEDQQYTTSNHDVGFMIYCSYGNGYRLTHHEHYKQVILTAAKSLATRFRPTTGVIRSWDWGEWQYPVIIDNMMNLELLFFASHDSGYAYLSDIAKSHADVTMANHFRPDGSSYHVVSYDTITGKVLLKQTRQGYSDESAWARGQAWALYGYTMCYRETGDKKYLEQAQKIAKFIMNHPDFPEDKIPYWDFNDPEIPDTYRDASAGAIMCSAFIELSQLTRKKLGKKYLSIAETQLRSLSSPAYRARPGENGNFLLKHGVGSKPENSEVDVPLTYADYYYIEAMMRYKKLKGF